MGLIHNSFRVNNILAKQTRVNRNYNEVFQCRQPVPTPYICNTMAPHCLVSNPGSKVVLCRHRVDFPSRSAGPRRKPPPAGSTAGIRLHRAWAGPRCLLRKSRVHFYPLHIFGLAPVGYQSVQRTSSRKQQTAQRSLGPTARRDWNWVLLRKKVPVYSFMFLSSLSSLISQFQCLGLALIVMATETI
jgi:hypothetical protein